MEGGQQSFNSLRLPNSYIMICEETRSEMLPMPVLMPQLTFRVFWSPAAEASKQQRWTLVSPVVKV